MPKDASPARNVFSKPIICRWRSEPPIVGGFSEAPLQVTAPQARAAVHDYLVGVGAYQEYPGLRTDVEVHGARVVVRLTHTVDLPLSVPGAPQRATVSGTGSAVADPESG